MKPVLPLLFLCCAIVLSAGCVNPYEPALVLPTIPPVPTTPPVPPPMQVQTTTPAPDFPPAGGVPPLYRVSIQIQKNPITTKPWISVVYEGSIGRVLPAMVEATVIRSDGITEQKSARTPPRGTQLLFNGTTGADRVIVNVTYVDGSIFTVKDEVLPLRTAGTAHI